MKIEVNAEAQRMMRQRREKKLDLLQFSIFARVQMSHNVPQCPIQKDVFSHNRSSADRNLNAGERLGGARVTTLNLDPRPVGHFTDGTIPQKCENEQNEPTVSDLCKTPCQF